MPENKNIKFAFFGSSRFSVIVLDELEKQGVIPSLVITTPDKPQGRKMTITPNPVKAWAQERKINVYDPAKLDAALISKLKDEVNKNAPTANINVFIVASYGKIIPQAVLDIPSKKTLNIHPSLLPKYRGASPLQAAILDDAKDTGVTIMEIDADMDHGPLVVQENIHINEWPCYEDFEEFMAKKGADLLAGVLADWTQDKIIAKAQNHDSATFTKKTKKEDGLIDFELMKPNSTASPADQYVTFRKIQAFHEWPQAFFMIDHGGKSIRVKITKASWNGKLTIEKVIPEGSKEMTYDSFLRGYLS